MVVEGAGDVNEDLDADADIIMVGGSNNRNNIMRHMNSN